MDLKELARELQKEQKPTETDPRVLDMVRKQLRRDPPPPLGALYGRAVRIDRKVRRLDLREFNARYALRARRELSAEENGARKPEISTELRGKLRGVLFQYARLVAGAETGSEVVDVVQRTDHYADAIRRLLSEETNAGRSTTAA